MSEHLNEWIDLIFGDEQQGVESEKALNVFMDKRDQYGKAKRNEFAPTGSRRGGRGGREGRERLTGGSGLAIAN